MLLRHSGWVLFVCFAAVFSVYLLGKVEILYACAAHAIKIGISGELLIPHTAFCCLSYLCRFAASLSGYWKLCEFSWDSAFFPGSSSATKPHNFLGDNMGLYRESILPHVQHKVSAPEEFICQAYHQDI